jgi:hypothetical protein
MVSRYASSQSMVIRYASSQGLVESMDTQGVVVTFYTEYQECTTRCEAVACGPVWAQVSAGGVSLDSPVPTSPALLPPVLRWDR